MNWAFELNHWNTIQMKIINAKMKDSSVVSQEIQGST